MATRTKNGRAGLHGAQSGAFRRVHPLLWRMFQGIALRRLQSSFRALRLADADAWMGAGSDTASPAVVYLNHPSWWDPLLGFGLSTHLFGGRPFYAPMDEEALERYRLLSYVGMFPVATGSPRGAAQFLRAANAILQSGNLLALTPEGRFTDSRERPVRFRPGLAGLLHHRARRGLTTVALPLAVEYTFWDQRLPEALALCGEPLHVRPGDARTSEQLQLDVETRLQTAQDRLAGISRKRDAEMFTTVLEGRRGSAGFYSFWESMQMLLGRTGHSGDHQAHPHGPRS